MGEITANYCPGHSTHLFKECEHCTEDYDISHHPNNLDCNFCKLYWHSRKEIELKLKEEKCFLSESILERITINLFLRQLINPNSDDFMDYIDKAIAESFIEDKKRREHLDNRERIYIGLV